VRVGGNASGGVGGGLLLLSRGMLAHAEAAEAAEATEGGD
jgi:hypothetical protein